jgi:hypothetical protein
MKFVYQPDDEAREIILNHQNEMKLMRGAKTFGCASIIDRIVKEWAKCRNGELIPKPYRKNAAP